MKRMTLSLTATLLLVASAYALHAGAAGTMIVSAGGSGAFSSASALLGVDLNASTFGSGVSFNDDGTVDGNLEELLTGADSITGLPATILVEATITGGTANADGSATVSGTATVTMASQTLTGVPVTALMTTSGITLTVGTTTLSPQTVTDGAIHIGPQ